MLDDLIPIIAILSAVALPIGFGMYLGLVYFRNKHRENMELIKQGIVPVAQEQAKPTPNKYRALRNGFLSIGIGIGLFLGILIINLTGISEGYGFMIVASSVLLFLGSAYVLFFLVVKDKNLEE